jgi:hypothetical protein
MLTVAEETVSQTKTAVMNYANYETQVVQKLGSKLVGWTFDQIVSPFEIHRIDDVRTLVEALRSGQCHWERMTRLAITQHARAMEEREKTGEIIGKKRKQRSDAGKKRVAPTVADTGMTPDTSMPLAKKHKSVGKQRPKKPSQQLPPTRSKSVISSSDEEEE